MIIRRKLFASTPQPGNKGQQPVQGFGDQMSSRDLQLEQMKLQRQLLQTERMKQKMRAEERRDEARRLMQQQKLEQQKEVEDNKQRIRTKKMESGENNVNVSLYKTKSHPTAPVPMK